MGVVVLNATLSVQDLDGGLVFTALINAPFAITAALPLLLAKTGPSASLVG